MSKSNNPDQIDPATWTVVALKHLEQQTHRMMIANVILSEIFKKLQTVDSTDQAASIMGPAISTTLDSISTYSRQQTALQNLLHASDPSIPDIRFN